MMKRFYLIFMVGMFIAGVVNAQESRQITAFNEGWNFTLDTTAGKWEAVTLPHTWNRYDMQLSKEFYTGDGFYKKELFIDDHLKGKRIFLKFGAVGQVATVYVNGRFLTEHRGGYSAFSFEITNVVKYGEVNEILVKANNKQDKSIIPLNHFLFPIYGGLYRTAEMIVTSPVSFTVTDYASPGIQIIQEEVSPAKAKVLVKAKLENKEKGFEDVVYKISVRDREGKVVSESEKKLTVSPQGTTYTEHTVEVRSPHLWDGIRDPYLYKLSATLIKNGVEIDRVDQPLGLRKIELVAGKGVWLNGKKYPMYGVTRHQDRWQFGNALSAEQEKEDMMLIKEMGVTTIRLAHYQQSEHIYALCDSLGFLTWAEIPFVNAVSLQEGANAKQQMTELVRQNRNHPSIYIWGLHNEVYSRTKDDFVPVLSRELNDIAKTDDPYRYTVSVNGYGTMSRGENLAADVQGMNRYYGWYEGEIGDLEKWASGLEKDYPGYMVMLTEYGADGNIDQGIDTLPLKKSIDPVNGQFSPENYQTETHIVQWSIIQKHPYLLASYLWNSFEFSTPMWDRGGVRARNLKGLITFDRQRKKDAFYWYKANWNPEPMVYIANRRDSLRSNAENTVQVFSNISQVVLKVNGKTIKGREGVNSVHTLYDIKLKKGKNIIQAIGRTGGNIYLDEIVWLRK